MFTPAEIKRVTWWQGNATRVLTNAQASDEATATKKVPTTDTVPGFIILHKSGAGDSEHAFDRLYKHEYSGTCFMYPRKRTRSKGSDGHSNVDELPLTLLSHFL